ncbi:MAG: glycoside hydrolase domain-containing protein, partial [Candidatus Ratteibacteria bacterium]
MKKVYFLFLILSFFVYGEIPEGFSVLGKEGERQIIPEGWEEISLPKESLPEIEKEGYIIFRNNYLNLIYPTTVPRKYQITKDLYLFASIGEYEPITFCVYPIEELKDVKVDITDLTDEKGEKIEKENVDIRVVRYLYRGKEGKYKVVHHVLEKKEKIDIPKDFTTEFWLTIYVPENINPSDYKGKIIFQTSKRKDEINVLLKVLPIKLKDPEIDRGMFFSLDTRMKATFYPENLKKYFLDMKSHGLNSVVTNISPKIEIEKGNIKLDFSVPGRYWDAMSLEKFVDIYKESGLTGSILYHGSWEYGHWGILHPTSIKEMIKDEEEINEEKKEYYFKEITKKIDEYARKKGLEFIFWDVDEPANSREEMKEAIRNYKLLHESGVKTICTLNGLWGNIDDSEILGPYLTHHCYNYISPKVIEDTKKRGKILYTYNGGSGAMGTDPPLVDRYYYGFYLFKTGAKGIYQWIYYTESKGMSIFDIKDQGRYYYVFPTKEGPLPTPYWEALREGIDDLKYIYTLSLLIEKAKKLKNENLKDE